MKEIPEFVFPPETEQIAIKLAAYDILRQLCEEGRISKAELQYIAEKHNISCETME
ncbi:MAG: hypothetical protein J6O73_17005 [Lachnospiraceae bacterium]|nr:hypothetical protein [Lachnospiraceae bacterium]